ncbi:MAG TPA: nucleotidyltransferase family protein, partial [Verrucomicrobiota bacterium]|nr:nucleotidyltransferase family protein [Verrucomicrobiota bacterium]
MKAVLLAAGKGTRMQDLTAARPKPMLPVQGRPILEHILLGLRDAGVREACLVTGWKEEVIRAHFGGGAALGLRLEYVRQTTPNGTGSATALARDFVGRDDFLLSYGDILVRPETYARVVARFRERAFDGVISVTEGEDVTQGGLNFFDQDFVLARLVEKPSPAQLEALRAEGWLRPGQPAYYNAGIYAFTAELFDFTARLQKSPRGEYELTDAISAMVAAGRKL